MFLEVVKALLKVPKAMLNLAILLMCWSSDTNVTLSVKCWQNYQDGYMEHEASEDEQKPFQKHHYCAALLNSTTRRDLWKSGWLYMEEREIKIDPSYLLPSDIHLKFCNSDLLTLLS